jgi:hypothetical protein
MNFGQTAKQVLAAVAPLIGTALGGPFGGLAGTVLAKFLGSNDPKAIEASITSGDPDILLKLKNADNEFKQHMADLGIQEEQLQVQDVESARAREMMVRDWTPRVLAVLVVLLTFGLEGSLLMGWHQPANVAGEVLGRILGTLDTATVIVLSYYFGSSVGARQSAQTLGEIAKQP